MSVFPIDQQSAYEGLLALGCLAPIPFVVACLKKIRKLRNEIRHLREQAQLAVAAAEAASNTKSEFLANTSHEIRTPMNSILGMARLLQDSTLTDEQKSWAKIILDSGESLLAIINDILDFSKIEAGQMTLSVEPIDLYSTMADVMDLLIFKADKKGIAMLVEIDPDVPRYVYVDGLRLKQIALNLLGNAKKFTSAGHVRLLIRRVLQSHGGFELVFSIEDTGIGIAGDKLEHIFDKFTQAENSTARRYGGTGLGLAISHSLVKLMGGRIDVESVLGKGSVFTFSLPLREAAPPFKLPSLPDVRGKNILVLGDNILASNYVKRYMESYGARAEICNYPSDVLNTLLKSEKRGDVIDYFLINSSLGGAQILELIERIKIYPQFQSIAVLATAIWGTPTATRLSNSKMIDALLPMPLFADQLLMAMQIIQKDRSEAKSTGLITRATFEKHLLPENTAPLHQHGYQGARVLVVEDIEVNQILMAKILDKFGCKHEAAMSGAEALKMLEQNDYDLIFMDGHMPGMDGLEATRRIRKLERESGRNSIIVALTADAMSGDEQKYISAGMNDYLNKPVMPERIAAMLNKWVAV